MLSSYPNVFNTCLVLKERRGYLVHCEQPQGEWLAEKDGFKFISDNPIELLGLITIREDLKPERDVEYWWKIDTPNLLNKDESR